MPCLADTQLQMLIQFPVSYLQANKLLVRSSTQPQSRTVVGTALAVSKRENLTMLQLKVLTDVVHYEVNKKPQFNRYRRDTSSGARNKGVRLFTFT